MYFVLNVYNRPRKHKQEQEGQCQWAQEGLSEQRLPVTPQLHIPHPALPWPADTAAAGKEQSAQPEKPLEALSVCGSAQRKTR